MNSAHLPPQKNSLIEVGRYHVATTPDNQPFWLSCTNYYIFTRVHCISALHFATVLAMIRSFWLAPLVFGLTIAPQCLQGVFWLLKKGGFQLILVRLGNYRVIRAMRQLFLLLSLLIHGKLSRILQQAWSFQSDRILVHIWMSLVTNTVDQYTPNYTTEWHSQALNLALKVVGSRASLNWVTHREWAKNVVWVQFVSKVFGSFLIQNVLGLRFTLRIICGILGICADLLLTQWV